MSRYRSTWLAASGALVLVLAVGGAAFAADTSGESASTDPTDATTVGLIPITTAFVDADGDGVDDACDPSVVADPVAAAAAEAAVDTNADGVVSVTEAAQSDRVGGTNCNHGGYVSGIARAQCEGTATGDDEAQTGSTEPVAQTVVDDEQGDEMTEANGETEDAAEDAADKQDEADTGDCGTAPTTAVAPTTAAAPTTACVPVAAPTFDPATMTGPGAFGRYVSSVAQSDAVGGKNCNHGGAVSEAVHTAKAAAKAARDAAKAERKAAHGAAKVAAKAARSHGNKGTGGH